MVGLGTDDRNKKRREGYLTVTQDPAKCSDRKRKRKTRRANECANKKSFMAVVRIVDVVGRPEESFCQACPDRGHQQANAVI